MLLRDHHGTRHLLAFLAALVLTTSVTLAQETVKKDFADITTINETRYEVLVDVAAGDGVQTWHNVKTFCMLPKTRIAERYPFRVPSTYVRMTAEIKLNGCESGTHKVLSLTRVVGRPGMETFKVYINEQYTSGIFGMRQEP